MTSAEYLYDLRKRLSKLPPEEVERAMAYYEEYFAEAGPGEEADLIARLGTPAEVASTIISDYAIRDVQGQSVTGSKKGGLKTMWIVIIAVLASPIAIPLAIALFAVVFALLIAIFSVYFSFFITAIALAVVGIVAVCFSIAALIVAPLEGITLMGAGLICLALGLAAFIGTIKLCQLTVKAITWIFAKILGKKGGQ